MENKTATPGRRIVQYSNDISVCAGCNACEIVCALVHEGKTGPSLRRIFLKRDTINMDSHTVYTCQQCLEHPCYDACPKKDQAMCLDESGSVYSVIDYCIGCRGCYRACPFEPKRIGYDKHAKRTRKCDLCRTRKKGPACVEFCQVRCLGISDNPLPSPPPAPAGIP